MKIVGESDGVPRGKISFRTVDLLDLDDITHPSRAQVQVGPPFSWSEVPATMRYDRILDKWFVNFKWSFGKWNFDGAVPCPFSRVSEMEAMEAAKMPDPPRP